MLNNSAVEGVAPLPHRQRLILITGVTAKLTSDRCVASVFINRGGLLPVRVTESNAEESGVAVRVVPVTASYTQSSQALSALQSNRLCLA